jgi:CCR4-NOT transcription complex subunit 1
MASEDSFSREAEEETNAFFEKLYKREISVSDGVAICLKYSQSRTPKDQEVLRCIIHYLFEEYKFLSRYPEQELLTTAALFGSLVSIPIFPAAQLGVALRLVLEGLRQTPGSNLFLFGLEALKHFESRLSEWPQYLSMLLQVSHLQTANPEYYAVLEKMNGNPPLHSVPAQEENNDIIFMSIVVEKLPEQMAQLKLLRPDEKIQDRILFLINNLSQETIASKIIEMKEMMNEKHVGWFSEYLVVKRVSIEPNFHSLYIHFIEGLNDDLLRKFILYDTFTNISSLVNSEKTSTSPPERTILKNLGSWLGAITLAKNRPILHKNIGFKVFNVWINGLGTFIGRL